MPISIPVQTAEDVKTIKAAVIAREYGASELMLATMTGHYPPPHEEMDQQIRSYVKEQYTNAYSNG